MKKMQPILQIDRGARARLGRKCKVEPSCSVIPSFCLNLAAAGMQRRFWGGSGWLSTLPPCHKVRVDKLGGSKDKTTAPPEQICSYFGGTMGQTDRQSSPSPWHRPSGTVPVPYTQAQILPASIKPSEKGFMEAKPSLGSC